MNCKWNSYLFLLTFQATAYHEIFTKRVTSLDISLFRMEGADLCIEIVKRATAGFVYSEAVARY